MRFLPFPETTTSSKPPRPTPSTGAASRRYPRPSNPFKSAQLATRAKLAACSFFPEFALKTPTPRDITLAAAGALAGALAALLLVTLAALAIPSPNPSQRAAFTEWEASQTRQEGHSATETGEVAP